MVTQFIAKFIWYKQFIYHLSYYKPTKSREMALKQENLCLNNLCSHLPSNMLLQDMWPNFTRNFDVLNTREIDLK